jgi:hypothetical protein
MKMDFNILCEMAYQRFQQGGFLIGDRVKFRKDWFKHEFFKGKGESFLDIIKSCTAKDFDLNLRIAAIKSIWPTTSQNYRGGSESPDNIYVDLVIEYAPGLYRTPITVPIEVLELQDDGINTGPVPDSIKRKNRVHKPEDVKTKDRTNFDINLQNKNVQIPSQSKTQNDSKPSTGWTPLPVK